MLITTNSNGQRNKEINNDIISHLKNRNQLLGIIDPANRLPTVISPVTGEAPNKYTMLQRIYNSYSPLKIHPAMSKEEQFLYDIEYDVSSAFKKRNGVDLINTERAELSSLMGKRGYFREQIKSMPKHSWFSRVWISGVRVNGFQD